MTGTYGVFIGGYLKTDVIMMLLKDRMEITITIHGQQLQQVTYFELRISGIDVAGVWRL